MRLGVPREVTAGEARAGATPQTVARYVKAGWSVVVEAGAGEPSEFADSAFVEAGATISADTADVWSADVVFKVQAPTEAEVPLVRKGGVVACYVDPARNGDLLTKLGEREATIIAMDQVPRVTRAQKMDVLSSMANIAGYRAVIEAANVYGSFFTGQITAAGKIPPAKILIIGAGVAGLAAIGTARGLGAVVRAFDVRPAVAEECQSLGADFLMLEFEESGDGGGGYAKIMSDEFIAAEMAMFREQAKEIDIVITTAAIPGRKAPVLWMADMVETMRPGGVIVDLAAATGGNCELTVPGETVVKHGVTIIGDTNLIMKAANTASRLYASNLRHLMDDLGKTPEDFNVDMDDEVIRGATVLKDGELTWPPPKVEPKPVKAPPKFAAPAPKIDPAVAALAAAAADARRTKMVPLVGGGLLVLWVLLKLGMGGQTASEGSVEFLQHFTVFVLAVFVGWQLIWSVAPALHTPLMSVTNAISGIIIVGGIIQLHGDPTSPAALLGAAAVLLAMINVAGGFLVTQRMLQMFRK
jgi:H+-translocating NAD(P) transhydrogenase subunit alpha